MGSLNEIELLADRGERIRQYHAVVAADARHHRAWNNLAVDLLAAGRWIEARRAALTVRAIDPTLGSSDVRAAGDCTDCAAGDSIRQQRVDSRVLLWWSPGNRRIAFVVVDELDGKIVRGQVGAGALGP